MNDLIRRQEAIYAICTEGTRLERNGTVAMVEIKQWCVDILEALPSAQPPLEEFEWCTDCKEYDQKDHCCHRFTKVIRKTVEELKVVRCKDCIHNNDCEIQYAAQTNDWFYCGYGERSEQE